MHIERENPLVLAKVTQMSDVAHEPLVFHMRVSYDKTF
jgi:hypothetical protein